MATPSKIDAHHARVRDAMILPFKRNAWANTCMAEEEIAERRRPGQGAQEAQMAVRHGSRQFAMAASQAVVVAHLQIDTVG